MIVTEDEARAYVAGMTDSAGMARLATLAAMVLDENQRQNLIARATEPHIWQRHIADSAQLLENVSREHWVRMRAAPGLISAVGPAFPGSSSLPSARTCRSFWSNPARAVWNS